MIEIKLIPDGAGMVPAEAKDDGVVMAYLEANVAPSPTSPIEGWRDVERVVPGGATHLSLRLPGSVSDYTDATLESVETALTNNINGLKRHPEGWHDLPDKRTE